MRTSAFAGKFLECFAEAIRAPETVKNGFAVRSGLDRSVVAIPRLEVVGK